MSIGSDVLLSWMAAQQHLNARRRAVDEKLALWKVKKTYDRDKALKAYAPVISEVAADYVTNAAAHYLKGGSARRAAAKAFPKCPRSLAAIALEKLFCDKFKAGQWAALQAEQKTKDKASRERAKKTGHAGRRR